MAKFILFSFLCVLTTATAQRITTIQLDGVQYFISRMNPYSPELNYFLAYQYCRSLGLQLASFETKEKVESISQYLQNAGYSKYDFWTSGNSLGTGMFLWMSTGLPFNATFDYFENSTGSVEVDYSQTNDHNSNTAPQRTARDSNSGMEKKGCVIMKAPNLKWMSEDCSVVKDFICEQTRCYYYNYGSIPVSSAQGRPVLSTARPKFVITTSLPQLMTSTNNVNEEAETPTKTQLHRDVIYSEPPWESLNMDQVRDIQMNIDQSTFNENLPRLINSNEENYFDIDTEHFGSKKHLVLENNRQNLQSSTESVEENLKQISQEIDMLHINRNSNTSHNIEQIDENSNVKQQQHQSFLSLSDLIRTLRPIEKKKPQIDSDYSNTMRVLAEAPVL